MAYCPGCGIEIAENAAFCPYCGINLRQSAVAENGDTVDLRDNDANASRTENKPVENKSGEDVSLYISSSSGISSSSSITSASEGEKNDFQADSPNQAANELYANKNASAVQIAKENNGETTDSENVEILNPIVKESSVIDSRIEDTGENVEKAKYENFVIDRETIKNESEIAAAEEPVFVSSEGEKANSSHAPTESDLMDYEEVEVKEGAAVEELLDEANAQSEIVTNEKKSAPRETDSTELSNDAPGEFTGEKHSISEKAEKEINVESEFSPTAQAPEHNVEKPISKPQIELEPAEIHCPSPRFDSVRIMEKPVAEKAENSSFDRKAQGDSVPVAQSSPATRVEQTNVERSLTTPNIAPNETDGKKSAKLKPLEEGTVLNNRYEIVRKIGGGGMGAVYLASDKNLGGVLRAVKEMVQSYIEDAQQEKAVSDFKRESLLLTSLEHQSIPTIYDYFFDEKEARFYLVMKYISGGDLASRLRSAPENRIDERVVTEWAIQILDVLDYLHNRQPAIIYRDLKPANIMIDANSNRVMLIDFGIARWVNKEEKGVTAVGTMGYAPPELFSGNVEPRSDIYSLGSTLFHLLTGADPQSNPLLIFDFQKHPRPRQINSRISDQMEKILMRSVEYSSDRRFASAAEMRAALERHLLNLKTDKVTYGIKETPSPAAFSDQPVFCGFCGQKIVATDMFCAFCGAKQPLAQKGVQSQSYSPTRITAQLLILGTNDLQTPAFRLEKDENLVGRRDPMSNIFPEIDLSKFDPQTKISRKHARIWREGTNFLVEDLGSSNGTLVLQSVKENVRLLPHQPFTLNDGDKIKLGDTTLHFVVAE